MNVILWFFYSVFAISILRLSVRLLLSLVYQLERKAGASESFPMISIVVPAYNEELTIGSCIRSLLDLDYGCYEVVVVDDGSTDSTLVVAQRFSGLGVRVIHQGNGGKAKALNSGIAAVRGDIVVTVDADTRLHRGSLKRIADRFSANRRLGAIAGNVKVAYGSGLLNVLQAAEYIVGINLVRKAQSTLGSVMVVPGPIAALRRAAAEDVGFFSDDTFAEDFDITMKILRAGYEVEYEDRAIAYTDAPKSLEDLMKQRRRWYRGMIQVLDKYREMYLGWEYGYAGIFGVPNLWFETVSPVLNGSLILLALLSGFVVGDPLVPSFGISLYFLVDLVVGVFAMGLDPEPGMRGFLVALLLPLYNVLLDGVRVMALAEEMVDIVMEWEKPRR